MSLDHKSGANRAKLENLTMVVSITKRIASCVSGMLSAVPTVSAQPAPPNKGPYFATVIPSMMIGEMSLSEFISLLLH